MLDVPGPRTFAPGPRPTLSDRVAEFLARGVMLSVGAVGVVVLLLVLVPLAIAGVVGLIAIAAWLWARAAWARLMAGAGSAGPALSGEGRRNVRVRRAS